MFRFAVTLCLLSMLLASAGCRMCPTPHDYRITGYVDRYDDYRGFNPHYRAGSVLGEVFDGYSTAGDIYHNAGNFGTTTPVILVNREPNPDMFRGSPTNIPLRTPENGGVIAPPRPNGIGIPERPAGVPSIQDLLDRQRDTTPDSRPIIPSVIPDVAPPSRGMPDGTIPFSPSDAQPAPTGDEVIIPPPTVPRWLDTDLPITLEELQRLDPSVQDIQIISIEDASVDANVK